MSVDRARQLMTKLEHDAAFRSEIERATPPGRVALLESHGFGDITRADLQAATARRQLSDAELQAVAGGAWFDPILEIIFGPCF
jgi:predicted ribosomally synthesized peptide with nif11-like leader